MKHPSVAEFRVLPEVIDFSVITNTAGLGALVLTMFGAAMRYDYFRLAQLALLGTVLGGAFGIAWFFAALLIDVL